MKAKLFMSLALAGMSLGSLSAENTQVFHGENGSVQVDENGNKLIKAADGSLIEVKKDGSKLIHSPDGTTIEIKADGSKEIKKADGTKVEVPARR